MFCPKCGTNNPDDGKFCRSCGTGLGTVSAALSSPNQGILPDLGFDPVSTGPAAALRRKDPDEVFSDAIKAIISGIGFVIISMVLFFTGVAGGGAWWWAMLFPAFTFLSKGIADLVRARRMERSRAFAAAEPMPPAFQPNRSSELPPAQTQFVSPRSRYQTGDLVPPSVTEGTTRHLARDTEGQTMTLPKRDED